MTSPCIIDSVAIGKNALVICVIDENADVFNIVASNCSRIKGYIKFNLSVGVSYHKDEQKLSEPLSTSYNAIYDRETHAIKIAFETHIMHNPYPSWWDSITEHIVEFIKGSVKNGKWEWRRKNST